MGKTSLLEALFVQQAPNDTMSVMKVNRLRGSEGVGREPREIWGSLFNDLDTDRVFQISTLDDIGIERRLRISLASTDRVKLAAGGEQDELLDIESRAISERYLEFQYSEDGKQELSGKAFRTAEGVHGIGVKKISRPNGSFLGARSRTSTEALTRSYGELVKKKKQEQILRYLRIIEPGLRSLDTILTSTGAMLYGDLGREQQLPIYALGDGIGRLLAISLSFATLAEGILLIDEVENGIYYKSMPKAWEIIRKMAIDYDVQVFATTHSHECICAAHEAFKNVKPKNFKFFRLDRRDDKITPAEYDIDTLAAAIGMNLEVR